MRHIGVSVTADPSIRLDSPNASSVDVDNVSLSYGPTPVLKGISLAIKPGELFSFLGPSGCGKTTLLRLIAGFATADTGHVRIAGQDVSGQSAWKRDVGLVFQSYALWPHMTVARNVAFGLEERRVPRAEIGPRVEAALQIVGLAHLAERRPSELSGGQQQRVAVARTIVVRPKVLLLDEPLSNLDAKLRVEVRRELRTLQTRLGITTIFVTHDQEEANTISDRIAVMNDGQIQQVGTPMELYARPVNRFVAGFLGMANVLDGRVVGDGDARSYEIAGGLRIPIVGEIPVGSKQQLLVRPQAINLRPRGGAVLGGEMAGTVVLPGIVGEREYLGAVVRYAVRTGEVSMVVDAPFRDGEQVWNQGEAVSIVLPQRALHWVAA